MLSMNMKKFGMKATLGAVALGLGLAGAASVSTPAMADGWHHGGGGWHGGYGGYHGWYGPRVTFGYGYPYYYPAPRVYYPPAYYPPAYYGYPYGGGVSVTVPVR